MTGGTITSSDGLEITAHHSEGSGTLRLRGHLNIYSSPALRDRLLALLRVELPKAVVVDLTDITYIDSSGVATLIEALKMARTRHTTLCLQGLQGRLLHFFQVIGILTLFEKSGCGSASSVSKVS